MRNLAIGLAALLLSLPALSQAKACGAGHSAQAATTTYSADEMKPKKAKVAKKTAKKTEKVEYMRAVPSEPPKK